MTATLSDLTPKQRLAAAWGLWRRMARPKQLEPDGDWRIWVLLCGRSFGKTRTGSEQVVKWALETPGVRIALVAATFDDGRDVMVEGQSGVVSVLDRYGFREGKQARGDNIYTWNRSLGQLVLPNGSRMDLYSGQKPRQLRGPQHHYAWCDELPHWQYPRATWRQVRYGLRLPHPSKPVPFRTRTIVTTTPLPIPLIRELMARDDVYLTRGSTYENVANLDPEAVAELQADLEGTTEGRQELHGEVLDDVAGALINQKLLTEVMAPVALPEFDHLTVAIDPAVEDNPEVNDATGYAVVASGLPVHEGATFPDLPHVYVLHSDQDWLAPEPAMAQAGVLYDRYEADHVVIEANNGGKYLPAVLRVMCPGVPWKVVKAPSNAGKLERARALKALAEQNRLHLVGHHGVLGDELTTFTGAAGQPSPNVLDAVVWGQLDVLPLSAKPGRRRRAATLHG